MATSATISNVGLPRDLLCDIGHVTALWARLEYIIDSATRQALDHSGAPELDTALILPFRKRVALLVDFAQPLISHEQDRHHLKELAKNITRLQRLRDLIVHGSVSGSRFEDGSTLKYVFRRIRWDRLVRLLERHYLSVEQVESIAAEISDAVAIADLFEFIVAARARALSGTGEP